MTLLGSEHSILIRSKFRSGKSSDDWNVTFIACLFCHNLWTLSVCSCVYSQKPHKQFVCQQHLKTILRTLCHSFVFADDVDTQNVLLSNSSRVTGVCNTRCWYVMAQGIAEGGQKASRLSVTAWWIYRRDVHQTPCKWHEREWCFRQVSALVQSQSLTLCCCWGKPVRRCRFQALIKRD